MGERGLVEIGSYKKIPLLFSEVQYTCNELISQNASSHLMSSSVPRCSDQGCIQLKSGDEAKTIKLLHKIKLS